MSFTGLVLGGGDAANYALSTTALTGAIGEITRKTLTASLTGTASKTYDGTTTATLGSGNYSLSGDLDTDTVVLSKPTSGSYDDKNAGTGKTVTVTGLSISGQDAANYELSSTSVSGAIGTITAKALTVSGISAADKVYDGNANTSLNTDRYRFATLASNDNVTLDTSSYTATFADRDVGTGKTVTVSGLALGGTDARNYTLIQPAGLTAAITPAPLTVSLTGSVSKVYDGTTAAALAPGNYVLAGAVAGDAVRLNNPASGVYDTMHVGEGKDVRVAGLSVSGADAGNYALTSTTVSGAVGTITARPITVAAHDKSKLEGDPDLPLTYRMISGDLVNGDRLTGELTREPGEAPGYYSIEQGALTANSNYILTFIDGTLTIEPLAAPFQVADAARPFHFISTMNTAPIIIEPGEARGEGDGRPDALPCGAPGGIETCTNQPYPGNKDFSPYVRYNTP